MMQKARRTTLLRFTFLICFLFVCCPNLGFADYGLVATQKPYLGVVDLTENKVVDRIAVGGKTRSVVFHPDGMTAYAASGSKVIMVSLSTRTVMKTINLHHAVLSLKTDVKGRRVVVLGKKRSGKIFLLDPRTLKVKRKISLRASPSVLLAVDPGGSKAAVATGARKKLQVLSLLGSGSTVQSNGPQNISGLGFQDDKKLWFTTKNGPSVLRMYDVYRKRVTRQVRLKQRAGGSIAVDSFAHTAVVTGGTRGSSSALVDLARRKAAKIPVESGVFRAAFSFDRFYIYMLDTQRKKLTLIAKDKNTKAEVLDLPQDWKPVDIAVQRVPVKQQGSESQDYLLGSRYPNTLLGRDGDDFIDGFRGSDTLEGGPGNDKILGGTETDTISGGDGNDTINEESGSGKISGGDGNDTIEGDTGGDTIDGGGGDDIIDGGEHDDTLYGGSGNDRIVEKGLGNEPLIDGGDGDDYIDSGFGKDYKVLGGAGNDTIFGGSGVELIQGGDGNDKIDGGTGSDTLEGQAGDDEIRGSQDGDTILAGPGNNIVDGGSGPDKITAEEGDDMIVGGPGRDIINAGAGNDVIRAADKDNVFDMRATRSVSALASPLPVDTPFDTVDCGPGYDIVYTENTPPVSQDLKDGFVNCEEIIRIDPEASTDTPIQRPTIVGTDNADTIPGTAENDILLGDDGDDLVRGNDGNDYVDGENGNDKISGGDGDDEVQGRYGDDQVEGGEGNDYLVGGYGKDSLIGGPGNDILNSGDDPDTIDAGPGEDTIYAINGKEDTITCGPEKDLVFADLQDRIDEASCEAIRY